MKITYSTSTRTLPIPSATLLSQTKTAMQSLLPTHLRKAVLQTGRSLAKHRRVGLNSSLLLSALHIHQKRATAYNMFAIAELYGDAIARAYRLELIYLQSRA